MMLSNAELHRKIFQAVVQEVLGRPSDNDLKLGPWEINDFSSTFPIDWRTAAGRQGVYVKVPKVEIANHQVGLLSAADRQRGMEEYQSLVKLAPAWEEAGQRVRFVKPLAFFPDYNAVVTKRAYGQPLFAVLRRRDLCQRYQGPKASDRLLGCLNRLGQALSSYHQAYQEEGVWDFQAIEQKMRGYLSRLRDFQVNFTLMAQVGRALERLRGQTVSANLTDTIKGLDIRNILIDADHQLFLLDPGKLKRDYKETDLARFIVTCRILYWGSLWFFLRLTPHRVYEQSFLQGYYGEAQPSWVLTVFTIKELLKHWLMAYRVMGLKPWPRTFKRLLKLTYVDPFYRGQIAAELRKLEKEVDAT